MDLLVPILAHVKELSDFKRCTNLETMRDELRPLVALLKERRQIVAKREDALNQNAAVLDNGLRSPLPFEETQSQSRQRRSERAA